MITHPATQALCAAPEAPRPHATAPSAVEMLLLALLRSLLMVLLPASAAHRAAAIARTPSLRRLVAMVLRLQARAEAQEEGAWIPRCERDHEGARQVLIALFYGRKPRPRSLPAEMPPAITRIARAPPRAPPGAKSASRPDRPRTPYLLRYRN